MNKKKKKTHLMYIIGLSLAAVALVTIIVTAIICGNDILEAFGGKDTTGDGTNDTTGGDIPADVTTDKGDMSNMKTLNYSDFKAMWLSQYDLNKVYSQNGHQRSQKSFEGLMEVILKNVKANGINTVIVQMRPNADSMYPSEVYPASTYAVGAYGNEFDYDPIEIIIKMAHEMQLSVQAWINPMRGMTETEVKKIDSRYKIREWYDSEEKNGTYVVVVDKRLYLNPAYEEVRQLIVSGAEEILQRYDVDGVHMDDYFYPTQNLTFDNKAYSEYVKENRTASVSAFRKNNLNLLVSSLYSAVKAINPDALFGISPAGNMTNVTDKQYADVHTWCKDEGYIDYICPQVYFGFEHQTCGFVKVCKQWSSIIKNDNVKLYIGMTLGKAKSKVDNYAGTGKNEWAEHNDILKRCLSATKSIDKCSGVAYFCYQYYYNPMSGESVSETARERGNLLPLLKEITWN